MAAKEEGDCCNICLGEYKHPRILPCQHVFCFQCLSDYEAEKKQINCPNCMTEVEIPAGGVAALMPYIEDPLHETIEPEVCNVCEKGIKASFQCFECDKCMCDECKKFHDVFSSKHQVHKLQASEKSFCENHPEVLLKFYCKICKYVICQQCMDEDHNSKHVVLRIEDYFTEKKITFKYYQDKINAKLQKISEFTDRFIANETFNVNEVMQRVPKLQSDLKSCTEIARYREEINFEEDEILLKKLTAAIKHIDKPLNKSENIQELVDLTLKLESKIQTHGMCCLSTGIDKSIEDEMGTLDVTIGRLFSFPIGNRLFKSEVFFVGGIHWTISVTAQQSDCKQGTFLTLNSFMKEEDKELVDSVTTDLVFTLILDNKNFVVQKQSNSVVQKQSKTFSIQPSDRTVFYIREAPDRLKCELLYYDTIKYGQVKSLQILFDIKEIKYKKN